MGNRRITKAVVQTEHTYNKALRVSKAAVQTEHTYSKALRVSKAAIQVEYVIAGGRYGPVVQST